MIQTVDSKRLKCLYKQECIICSEINYYYYYYYTTGNNFVNVTLLSLKYSGPNVGYCKYGGLSVYDYFDNNMTEVLLLCGRIFPVMINTQPKHIVISSTQSLFLIFYAYWPYSNISLKIKIKPTTCVGVHVLRYNIIILDIIIRCMIYIVGT